MLVSVPTSDKTFGLLKLICELQPIFPSLSTNAGIDVKTEPNLFFSDATAEIVFKPNLTCLSLGAIAGIDIKTSPNFSFPPV